MTYVEVDPVLDANLPLLASRMTSKKKGILKIPASLNKPGLRCRFSGGHFQELQPIWGERILLLFIFLGLIIHHYSDINEDDVHRINSWSPKRNSAFGVLCDHWVTEI